MDDIEPRVRLVDAGRSDRDVVAQLLEFNAYEFSRFDQADVGSDGRFGYRYFDEYWTEPERFPFLIEVDGHIAGLALVRSGSPHMVGEFLVLPKYRRSGVGTAAARVMFSEFTGDWEVHQVPGNTRAVEFWHHAIPVPFEETVDDDGTTQRFSVSGGHSAAQGPRNDSQSGTETQLTNGPRSI